jgi:DNA repair exonuclease SbcCD nuclease subunit
MKIIHAADLHVDSPLVGLERYPGVPIERVRNATRAAFGNVIDLCLAERARFLVLAGDVFDGDWRDVNTGVWFVSQLQRLRAIGCRVVLLRGNHDFELTAKLRWPDFVFELPTARAKVDATIRFDDDGVAFHGVSYPAQKVTESLLPHYGPPVEGLLNVGVLHTNAVASAMHARYAPCTADELTDRGYDYWALGHVHEHRILRKNPWIVYPGNTQGRHARETGSKGCVVIEVEDARARVRDVRFHETCVMRWAVEEIALEPDDDRDELVARAVARLGEVNERAGVERMPCALRLEIRGACRAHAAVVSDPDAVVAQIRSDALTDHPEVWLEKIDLATSPSTSIEELRRASGLVADLLRNVEHLRSEEGEGDRALLMESLRPLKKKLAGELDGMIDFSDPDELARTIDRAEAWLAQRLTQGEGGGR